MCCASRVDLRRSPTHPATDRGTRRQDPVDLHDTMYPHLAARPRNASREQGSTSSHETTVANPGAIDVSMRPDQDIIADDRGVPRPAADHGVLHHDAAGADADPPVLGGEHGPEQHPGIGSDAHRAARDRRRRNIRAGMDLRDTPAMLDQHPPSLPATGTGGEHPDITPDQRKRGWSGLACSDVCVLVAADCHMRMAVAAARYRARQIEPIKARVATVAAGTETLAPYARTRSIPGH